MFFPFEFDSVNRLEDLADGTYQAVCSVYRRSGDARTLVLSEYRLRGESGPAACDLVVLEGPDVYLRDFLRMPDRTWRDSYGRRGTNLADLLPDEMSAYSLITREIIGEAGVSFRSGDRL